MITTATISNCKNYRYKLTRVWDHTKRKVVFIGLNPSTADEAKDDATIRKLITFAKMWGYGGFIIVNLFAFRSRNAYALLKVPNNFGPKNKKFLEKYSKYPNVVIMWGSKAKEINAWRAKQVINMIPHPMCFGKNLDGSPKHPLMLAYSTKLEKFR